MKEGRLGAADRGPEPIRGGWQRGPIVIRGAGDLATGVILRLSIAGFGVIALETALPLAVRRTVSLSEAVYEGRAVVEGLVAQRAATPTEAFAILAAGQVPVLVDPEAALLPQLGAACLVDAIMAKRNLGSHRGMAPLVIALGPGFCAGQDVDAVVETKRGHDLGRVIWQGPAEADTGIPGIVDGRGAERVLRAPCPGRIAEGRAIGGFLAEGERICRVEGGEGSVDLLAPFPGVLRGLLRDGLEVGAGLKIGDIDPRARKEHCFSVSDKSRAIAGGVLEALLHALCARTG